jgi:hypothetical protein
LVDDESQREEMNAAIRAQRERGAVPRSMLPPEDEQPQHPLSEPPAQKPPNLPRRPEPPAPERPQAEPRIAKRGLLARLVGRRDR